ncbi:hypothetical protein DY000_02059722 [Brassica cretica]|uniref:Uncharacterized protein n=1 Tax=Brassica cretica TaxID=69181 RepID=A0ABQ7AYE0_BRACR|nr:hypothetical protein DY000_02059722 [Brassica cretica]
MVTTAKTTAIRTGKASPPHLLRHVSPGPDDSTLKFRLLHLWEARKNIKGGPGILLGIEMLMIDAEELNPCFLSLSTCAQIFRTNQYASPLNPTPRPIQRRSYDSGYIAPFSEIIIPNPKRRLDLFLDSLPLPQLIPHNTSDESSSTSMCSHKSSIQDPYRPFTSPLRLDDI